MRLSKKSVFYDAGLMSASGIFLSLLRFLYRILLGRMLGAEGMGVYQLIFPVYSLIMSLTLTGLCTAVKNISSEMNALRDKCAQARLVSFCVRVFLGLFSAAALLVLIFPDYISKNLLGDERTKASLAAILICILFTGVENLLKSYFCGVGRIKITVISEITEQIIRTAAAALLMKAVGPRSVGAAVALVAWGMVISELFSSTFLWAIYKGRGLSAGCGAAPKMLYNKIFSVAAPVSAAAIASSTIYSINTVLVPRRLVAGGMSLHGALSAFGAISGMVMPLFMLPASLISALVTVLSPRIVAGSTLGKAADVRRKTARAIRVTSLLAFSAIGILLPLSPALCRAIFRANVATPYFLACAAAALVEYFEMISSGLLIGHSLQKYTPALTVICGGAEVLIIYWAGAIPGWGMFGIIAAAFVRSVLSTFLCLYLVLKKTRLKADWGAWFLVPACVFVIAGYTTNSAYLYLSRFGAVFGILASAGAGAFAAALGGIIMGVRPIRYLKTLIVKRPAPGPY